MNPSTLHLHLSNRHVSLAAARRRLPSWPSATGRPLLAHLAGGEQIVDQSQWRRAVQHFEVQSEVESGHRTGQQAQIQCEVLHVVMTLQHNYVMKHSIRKHKKSLHQLTTAIGQRS